MDIYDMIDETSYWMYDKFCPSEDWILTHANDNSPVMIINNSMLMISAVFNFIRTLPKKEANKVLNHINLLLELEIEERLRK